MTTCHAEAVAFIRKYIDWGWTLEAFLAARKVEFYPGAGTLPTIWIVVGRWLYLDAAGDKCIRLKPHEIGVAFHYRDGVAEVDGHNQHVIFNVRRLWDDILNPKPVQLPLWPDLIPVHP